MTAVYNSELKDTLDVAESCRKTATLFCFDAAGSVIYRIKHHLEEFAKSFLCNGQEKNVASLVHGSHEHGRYTYNLV